jgi:hypothetical protein
MDAHCEVNHSCKECSKQPVVGDEFPLDPPFYPKIESLTNINPDEPLKHQKQAFSLDLAIWSSLNQKRYPKPPASITIIQDGSKITYLKSEETLSFDQIKDKIGGKVLDIANTYLAKFNMLFSNKHAFQSEFSLISPEKMTDIISTSPFLGLYFYTDDQGVEGGLVL